MVLTKRIEFDVFDENDFANFRIKKRVVDQLVQGLPVTGSQEFERSRGSSRCSKQTLAFWVFANGFEQGEKRLLHACHASGAAARNFADAAFSRLQFSFGFGISVPHCFRLIEPALRIFFVVERDSLLGKLERVLRIEHDGQFFRPRCILAGHDCAGVRAVRNPAWMQRNRTALNPAPRTEIPANIKENFVSFDIVVYPWDFHGLRMRIEHSRSKRAHHITANLKRLMDGRWLMKSTCDRLKILRVKRKRIEIAIPPNRIEGMMSQRHAREPRSVFYQNIDVFLFVDGNYLPRSMKVALRIGRAHFYLALMI